MTVWLLTSDPAEKKEKEWMCRVWEVLGSGFGFRLRSQELWASSVWAFHTGAVRKSMCKQVLSLGLGFRVECGEG